MFVPNLFVVTSFGYQIFLSDVVKIEQEIHVEGVAEWYAVLRGDSLKRHGPRIRVLPTDMMTMLNAITNDQEGGMQKIAEVDNA